MTTIVSVSLPAELQAALDTEAKRQRRSRSFVVSEAIREFLRRQDRDVFASARDRTLRESLALAPSERVHLSDELWQDLTGGSRPTKGWTAAFETFDDYEAWRRRSGGRPA